MGLGAVTKTWYFGHTLYVFSLYLSLPGTRRHDSLNFLYTIDDFRHHSFGLTPKNICLDSAHDNIPTYELLEHWDINAFIDINGRTKSSEYVTDDIRFDKEGHSLCIAGYKMCSWTMHDKKTYKCRCPLCF